MGFVIWVHYKKCGDYSHQTCTMAALAQVL